MYWCSSQVTSLPLTPDSSIAAGTGLGEVVGRYMIRPLRKETMMRSRIGCACIPSVLILSGVALAQNTQQHPADHRLQLVGARQLAVKSFSTLPKGVLF